MNGQYPKGANNTRNLISCQVFIKVFFNLSGFQKFRYYNQLHENRLSTRRIFRTFGSRGSQM